VVLRRFHLLHIFSKSSSNVGVLTCKSLKMLLQLYKKMKNNPKPPSMKTKSLKRMIMKKIKIHLLILYMKISMKILKIELKVLLRAKDMKMKVKMKKHTSPLKINRSLKSLVMSPTMNINSMIRNLFHPLHEFMKKKFG
jgi:hypothetical protein